MKPLLEKIVLNYYKCSLKVKNMHYEILLNFLYFILVLYINICCEGILWSLLDCDFLISKI